VEAAVQSEFNETSLPEAVRWLFDVNGYSVRGPEKINGAEIDLIALQVGGLRPVTVYIEATIQYVDNTKYGKDLTKLAMVKDLPGAQCLIVSSSGFTLDVRERAAATGIDTYTYDELFSAFEKTEPYISAVMDGSIASEGKYLEHVYEEPLFDDSFGRELAPNFLMSWAMDPEPEFPWLIVVGEYGTGKTALTQVLQRRWVDEYRRGVGVPLPFRIELRDFTKQFDARGLLHYFLDRNELSHLPVTFVETMIAEGRVVLLLDGYDEMAQYLNVRERRACLEALADLAAGGARGILTSRPNYFTEAEELRVFEVLYQKFSKANEISEFERRILDAEQRVDNAFERFALKRRERQLRDLDPEQTEALVRRQLADDPQGAEMVVALLKRVVRVNEDESNVSLGGKPVIASYLLQVVSQLKERPIDQELNPSALQVGDPSANISEWQIFDLIVDNLMRRDHARTPQLLPSERRAFLGELALWMSTRQAKSITDADLTNLVRREFDGLIRRRVTEGQTDFAESLTDDLRSSATLARREERGNYAWQFSHNALREFLLADRILSLGASGAAFPERIIITPPMQEFARSLPEIRINAIRSFLASSWPLRRSIPGLDQLLCLCWDSLIGQEPTKVAANLAAVIGQSLDLSDSHLSGFSFPRNSFLIALNVTGGELSEIDFLGATLSGSDFSNAALDGCVFRNADLRNSRLDQAFLLDCEMTDVDLRGATARMLDSDSRIIRQTWSGASELVTGSRLRGYFRYRGAETDAVDVIDVFCHARDFEIVDNIMRNLSAGTWSQRRGLEQRGPSQRNVGLARRFVTTLLQGNLIQEKGGSGGNLVGPTSTGRAAILKFVEDGTTVEPVAEFLWRELGSS
jgi:hypothetical protein